MKKIQQIFLSSAVHPCGLEEPDDSVFAEDLVGTIPTAFQIECPVCLEILKEPVRVQCCGKNICSACIQRIQTGNGPCPCCQKKEYNSFHNIGLQQSLDKLKFECKFKSEGCSWTGGLKERRKHIVGCPKRSITCTHCNEFKSDFDDVTTNHLPVCGCYPILCLNGCGKHLQRKYMKEHREHACPETVIDCEFRIVGCKKQLKRKDMPLHLRENLSTHILMQCQSHQQLLQKFQNSETENTILRQQNQRLQVDFHQLQMQLKQVLDTSRETTYVPPDTRSSYDSTPMENSSDVAPVTGMFYSKQYIEKAIDWRGSTLQGEGIQLIIPENAIKPGDVVIIRIQECSSGRFAIPDGLALESPVFHISPSYHFQSEVTLVIEHFACIERITEYEDWVFLSSPTKPTKSKVTDQSGTGTRSSWEFHPHGNLKFSPDNSQQVSVQLKHFCFACLARKKRKGKKIINFRVRVIIYCVLFL